MWKNKVLSQVFFIISISAIRWEKKGKKKYNKQKQKGVFSRTFDTSQTSCIFCAGCLLLCRLCCNKTIFKRKYALLYIQTGKVNKMKAYNICSTRLLSLFCTILPALFTFAIFSLVFTLHSSHFNYLLIKFVFSVYLAILKFCTARQYFGFVLFRLQRVEQTSILWT